MPQALSSRGEEVPLVVAAHLLADSLITRVPHRGGEHRNPHLSIRRPHLVHEDCRSLRHTVAISEAPDDEAISAHLLEISSVGSVRTTALRAYDEEEMSEILRRLG
jgi:hypothetical protein